MSHATSDEGETFDPTRRRLCADGSCVGVLGDDGRCRVCGRTEAQASAGEAPAEARGDVDDGETPAEARGGGDAGEARAETGGFDAKRRLCDDGSCVGIVGNDGTCRVCGRRAE